MKWFKNLQISMRLVLSFTLITIITMTVGVTGLFYIVKMKRLDTEMYQKHTEIMPYLLDVAENYHKENVLLRMMYMAEGNTFQIYKEEFDQSDAAITTAMAEYGKIMEDPSAKEIHSKLSQLLTEFRTLSNEVIIGIQKGKRDASYGQLTGQKISEITETAEKYVDELMQTELLLAKQNAETNTGAGNIATIIIISVIILSIIVALGLSIYVSRGIIQPLNVLKAEAERLALGEVNIESTINTRDEIGALAGALDKMIKGIHNQVRAVEKIANGDLTAEVEVRSDFDLMGIKLKELVQKNNEVISNVVSAAEQVASGAKQLSDSSVSLSEGAGEQASAVEELTASLEEISSQTDLNANNANKANTLAVNAKDKAEQGNSQMKEMLKAMDEISESSSNISKIIKVIDDIAFQTNILALNAAVEAARAGNHGKGFAVVAEEVRNLAARSASAAKETTDMIENSIKKSDYGRKIAGDTAKSLNEIVNEVENVAVLVADIAMASSEQAIGIGQVNQGIMQVSQVTQANSATSQESASASEELASQAEILNEQVNLFKIKVDERLQKK